jgi:hypothetical protein
MVKIDVRGDRACLYAPTLVVNDLKTGAQGKGAVAPWCRSPPASGTN